MKKDYELTTFQKVFSIIFEVVITVIFLGGALFISIFSGYYWIFLGALAITFEFFHKDGDRKPTFKYGKTKDTSPSDGELVSYEEYPVFTNNSSSASNKKNEYSCKSSAVMDDIPKFRK